MDTKTSKHLQQAGKYVRLGKLTLALEQYLKIHELEPEDTTILNNIGDLYVRLDDKENAIYTSAFNHLDESVRKKLKPASPKLELYYLHAHLSAAAHLFPDVLALCQLCLTMRDESKFRSSRP